MTTIAEVTNWFKSQVGYTENPPNSNKTKYAAMAGLPNGVYWCDVFVSAGFKENKVPLPAGCITASTRASKAAWQKAGQWVLASEVREGDQLIYCIEGRNGPGVPDHTGYCIGPVVNGRVPAIEGNTSNDDAGSQSNGGGVFMKHRPLTVILGAGRPNYEQTKPQENEDGMKQRFYKVSVDPANSKTADGDQNIWTTTDGVFTHLVSGAAFAHFKALGWWDESNIEFVPKGAHDWMVGNNHDQNEG